MLFHICTRTKGSKPTYKKPQGITHKKTPFSKCQTFLSYVLINSTMTHPTKKTLSRFNDKKQNKKQKLKAHIKNPKGSLIHLIIYSFIYSFIYLFL